MVPRPATAVFSEPMIADDVMSEPIVQEQREAYAAEGIVSMMAVPLRIGANLSGTLVAYYRKRHSFSEVEAETARALGNLVSAAITTAELYDAQRRSREQSDMLAAATAALSGSLDYHETLRRIAQLAVTHLADWCAVDLMENGEVERLAVAHVDPVKVEKARELQEKYPADPDSPSGIHQVLRTGEPILVPEVSDEMLAARARSPEHLAAIRELGVRSYMSVPLRVHNRTVGVISFVSGDRAGGTTRSISQFAQDLASRAAMAVENARAYEEARRANRLKDEFLATLSHELRTPLNAILGYARMLKSGDGHRRPPAARHRDHRQERGGADQDRRGRARRVADRVGQAATQDRRRSTSRRWSRAASRRCSPAAEAKGIALHAVMDPGPAQVIGDPDRLQQVMWNLLSNAVKFTPNGGDVTVRLEPIDGHVEIVVTDTGVGIAPEFLPHIFERFRQGDSRFAREYGGLGLGLAIARHIVEMHGGTIQAFSEGPAKGSTFRVRLPVAHAVKAVVELSPRPRRGRRTGGGSRRPRAGGRRRWGCAEHGARAARGGRRERHTALSADEALAADRAAAARPAPQRHRDAGHGWLRADSPDPAAVSGDSPSARCCADRLRTPRRPQPRAPQRFPGPPRQADRPGRTVNGGRTARRAELAAGPSLYGALFCRCRVLSFYRCRVLSFCRCRVLRLC